MGTEDTYTDSGKWIITDVLGEGKFKAVPKEELTLQEMQRLTSGEETIKDIASARLISSETFDISGKIDTNNPIYRFYEKEVGKYLTNKYGAQRIKDPQGIEWYQVDIKKEMSKLPIEAFGILPFATVPFFKSNQNK